MPATTALALVVAARQIFVSRVMVSLGVPVIMELAKRGAVRWMFAPRVMAKLAAPVIREHVPMGSVVRITSVWPVSVKRDAGVALTVIVVQVSTV